MKHQIKKTNFAGSKSQMHALLKNMTKDLLLHEFLTTTKTRARAVKSYVDKILSRVKNDEASKRYLRAQLGNLSGDLEQKVFVEYIKRFSDKKSGFVRSYNLVPRKGDGAAMTKLIVDGYKIKSKSKLTKLKSEKVTDAKKSTKTVKVGESNKKDVKQSQVSNVVSGRAKSRSGI